MSNVPFITGAALLTLAATGTAFAQGTLAWDKTFPRNTRVDHQKVSFYNRLGITLVGDLYIPGNLDGSRRYPAIIVGHPYGGVKEQTSGLYAQTMAARGFITLAFDASADEYITDCERASSDGDFEVVSRAGLRWVGTRP